VRAHVASLQLVVELNRDPEPVESTRTANDPIAVPVAPRPEPSPEAPTLDDAAEPADASAAANAPTSVDPPSPRPPTIAGVAPTAGPGSLALPMATSELPSVATLPSAQLDTVVSSEPDTPARVTHRPAPTYPAIAQRRGIEGFVTLRLRIDARGRVEDAVVVESQPPSVFDRTALRTVRGYRFAPARSGGQAVPTTLQQTIRFELESE
jgi:periplasmic protein TonB